MSAKRIIAIFLFLSAYSSLAAQPILPADFYDTQFVTGFERARGMEFDANGRMYLYEHRGMVWIIDSSGSRLTDPLLDLREQTSAWFDHGLLGICLDRNFLENGYYYVLYAVDRYWEDNHSRPGYSPDSTTTNAATWGRISRFTATAATGFTSTIAGSERVLLGEDFRTGIPLHNNYHGLGKIKQAQDGTLLISVGDGAKNTTDTGDHEENSHLLEALELGIMTPDQRIGSYRSQYLNSLRGKILRIDPETGDGLTSNPFYNAEFPRSPASRIWALGLRNPYRFTIVPNTGSHDPAAGDPGLLYIGDVGNGAWEELNVCDAPGQNFGWPHYEGPSTSWSFWNKEDVTNFAAPNPLAEQGDCPDFLGFKQTFVRLGHSEIDYLLNPCDNAQVYAYAGNPLITPPALAWSNSNWNLPERSGTMRVENGSGIGFLPLSDPDSPVSGPAFGGFSSLAGFIVKGDQWPLSMQDKLLFYDYSGWIRLATVDANGYPLQVEDFASRLGNLHTVTYNPVNGRIFYLKQNNDVRELSFGGNPPPTAVGVINPNFGAGEITVNFSASGSSDQNSDPAALSYYWDFGDGSTSTAVSGTHTFSANTAAAKTFRPVLTVTDPDGATATDTLIVSLNNSPPRVTITSFRDGDRYPIDKTNLLELTASVTDAEHPNTDLTYDWQSYVHHNTHFHAEENDPNPQSMIFLEPLGCESEDYWFRVALTVTDPEGLSTRVEQELFPDCEQQSAVITELTLEGEAENSVEAKWRINSNVDGTHELQRAADIFNFATLQTTTFVPGDTEHTFRDAAPLQGTNYYRVKTITSDRKINYSAPVSIEWPRPLAFSLAPNPARREVRVRINEALAAQQFSFTLYNLLGQPVLTTEWELTDASPGLDQVLILPEKLSPQTYFFHLSSDAGISKSGKLTVVR